MAYFVRKLRFCGSFYFLRATAKQLDTIRFYYAMALSSILDMTVYETLGAACCKSASVSESAASFKKLLEITGMPSLRKIAIDDARIFIRQCIEIEPLWFSAKTKRLDDIEQQRKNQM